jgi:hypothetical protein
MEVERCFGAGWSMPLTGLEILLSKFLASPSCRLLAAPRRSLALLFGFVLLFRIEFSWLSKLRFAIVAS